MSCCPQCQGIEQTFNSKFAERELADYRRHGPAKTTRLLIDAVIAQGVEGMTLLDIGGGVGAIQHALLKAGASRVTSVDASAGYTEVARQEAEARGHADRIARLHGNFVDLAAQLDPADIVTLDRAICCYHDMPGLVGAAVGRARKLVGMVFPRDVWWLRAIMAIQHAVARLVGWKMQFFAHPTAAVEALMAGAGFERRFYRRAGMWQVIVYGRDA